ncbi:MAG: hypothetical protein AB1657_02855 [Candidatus Micrarchaeota archaeon]
MQIKPSISDKPRVSSKGPIAEKKVTYTAFVLPPSYLASMIRAGNMEGHLKELMGKGDVIITRQVLDEVRTRVGRDEFAKAHYIINGLVAAEAENGSRIQIDSCPITEAEVAEISKRDGRSYTLAEASVLKLVETLQRLYDEIEQFTGRIVEKKEAETPEEKAKRRVREFIERYSEPPGGVSPNITVSATKFMRLLERMGFALDTKKGDNGHRWYTRRLVDGTIQTVNVDPDGQYPRDRLVKYLTRDSKIKATGGETSLDEGKTLMNELLHAYYSKITGYAVPDVVVRQN